MHALLPSSSAKAEIDADILLMSCSGRSRVTAEDIRIIRAELTEQWEHAKGARALEALMVYAPCFTCTVSLAPSAAFVRDGRQHVAAGQAMCMSPLQATFDQQTAVAFIGRLAQLLRPNEHASFPLYSCAGDGAQRVVHTAGTNADRGGISRST